MSKKIPISTRFSVTNEMSIPKLGCLRFVLLILCATMWKLLSASQCFTNIFPLYIGDGVTANMTLNTIDADISGSLAFAGYDTMKKSAYARFYLYSVPFIGFFDSGLSSINWLKYVDASFSYSKNSQNYYETQIAQLKFYSNFQKIIALHASFNAIFKLDRAGNVIDSFSYQLNNVSPLPTISFIQSLVVDENDNFAISGVKFVSGQPTTQFRCFNSSGNILGTWEQSYYPTVPPIVYEPLTSTYQLGINLFQWDGNSYRSIGIQKFNSKTCNFDSASHLFVENLFPTYPNLSAVTSIVKISAGTIDAYQNFNGMCIQYQLINNQFDYQYIGLNFHSFGFAILDQNTQKSSFKHIQTPDLTICLENILYLSSSGDVNMNMVYQSLGKTAPAYSQLYLAVLSGALTSSPSYQLYQIVNEIAGSPFYGFYGWQAVFYDRTHPDQFYFAGSKNLLNPFSSGLLNIFDKAISCTPQTFSQVSITFLDEVGLVAAPYFLQISLFQEVSIQNATKYSVPYSTTNVVQPTFTELNQCTTTLITILRTNSFNSAAPISCPLFCSCTLDAIEFTTDPLFCNDAIFEYSFTNFGILINASQIQINSYEPATGQSYFTFTPTSASDLIFEFQITIKIIQSPSSTYTSPPILVNVDATITTPTLIPPLTSSTMLTTSPNCHLVQNLGVYTFLPTCQNGIPMTFSLTINGVPDSSSFAMVTSQNNVTISKTILMSEIGNTYNVQVFTYLTNIPTVQDSTVVFQISVALPTLIIPQNPSIPVRVTPYCPYIYNITGFALIPQCASTLSYQLIFNGTLSSSMSTALIPITINSTFTYGTLVLYLNPPIQLLYSTTTVQVRVTVDQFPSLSSIIYTFQLAVDIPTDYEFDIRLQPIPADQYIIPPNTLRIFQIGNYFILPTCLQPYLRFNLVFNGDLVTAQNCDMYGANIIMAGQNAWAQVSIRTNFTLLNYYYNMVLNVSVLGMPVIYNDSFQLNLKYQSACSSFKFTQIPLIKDQFYLLGSAPLAITYEDFLTDPIQCATLLDYFITVDINPRIPPYITYSKEINQISVQTSNSQYLGMHFIAVVTSSADLQVYEYSGFNLQISDKARIARNDSINQYSFPQLLTTYYNNNTYQLNYYDSIIKLTDLDSINLVPPCPTFISYTDGRITLNLNNVNPGLVTFTVNILYKGISVNVSLNFNLTTPPIETTENATQNLTFNISTLKSIQPAVKNSTTPILMLPLTAAIQSISSKGLLTIRFNYPLLRNNYTNWTRDDVLISYQKYGEDDKIAVNYSLTTIYGTFAQIQLYFNKPETISMSQVNYYSSQLQVKDILYITFTNESVAIGEAPGFNALLLKNYIIRGLIPPQQSLYCKNSFNRQFSNCIINRSSISLCCNKCNEYNDLQQFCSKYVHVCFQILNLNQEFIFAVTLGNVQFLPSHHPLASLLDKLAKSTKCSLLLHEQGLSISDPAALGCCEFYVQIRLQSVGGVQLVLCRTGVLINEHSRKLGINDSHHVHYHPHIYLD